MKLYGKYLKPYLLYFIAGPVLMLTEVVGEVFMPFFLAQIINRGIPNLSVGYVIVMGLLMALTGLLMMAGGVGGNWFACKASANFAADLRRDLFHKVQAFSFANIDKFSTGSLVTRLTNDVTQIQNLLRFSMIMLLRAPGMMIGAIIMAVTLNARLAVIFAIMMPLLAVGIGSIMVTAYPRFQAMQKKLDNLNSTIQEALTNVRVVKSFVREKDETEKFRAANKDLKDNSLRAFKVVIMNMPLMMLAMNITTILIIWFGGKQVIAGDMAIGDLTAFTTYIFQILGSLMMVAMIFLSGARAVASSNRIQEVLKTEVDLSDDQATKKEKTVDSGKIEFRDVSFRYYKNTEAWVLNKLNFTIESGQTIGIIGSTGSGKTSLVQLIPRLYDTDEGSVLVDGVDVREYNLTNLRNGVAMVLQKNVLFSGTIQDNLLWGDDEATDEEIFAAAEAAQAHKFVTDFPEGYQTELGQGGVNVSGGQKQRLCIARALLKKPKILILDDSTSAVDTATEAQIRKTFTTSLKDSTKIIIAQRISSVMDADQILVINEGQITGIGTHEELLATNTEYQEIFESQTSNDKEVG